MSLSFLFKVNDKNIIYTADIGCNEDLYLFITESTQITLNQIEQFELVQNPKKIIQPPVNISDEKLIQDWYNNLPQHKKQKFTIAEDGLEIILI